MRLARFGYRGLLVLLGGLSSLAGSACAEYGVVPPYGVDLTCSNDSDCTTRGADWYCDPEQRECVQRSSPDAGPPDAGQ